MSDLTAALLNSTGIETASASNHDNKLAQPLSEKELHKAVATWLANNDGHSKTDLRDQVYATLFKILSNQEPKQTNHGWALITKMEPKVVEDLESIESIACSLAINAIINGTSEAVNSNVFFKTEDGYDLLLTFAEPHSTHVKKLSESSESIRDCVEAFLNERSPELYPARRIPLSDTPGNVITGFTTNNLKTLSYHEADRIGHQGFLLAQKILDDIDSGICRAMHEDVPDSGDVGVAYKFELPERFNGRILLKEEIKVALAYLSEAIADEIIPDSDRLDDDIATYVTAKNEEEHGKAGYDCAILFTNADSLDETTDRIREKRDNILHNLAVDLQLKGIELM